MSCFPEFCGFAPFCLVSLDFVDLPPFAGNMGDGVVGFCAWNDNVDSSPPHHTLAISRPFERGSSRRLDFARGEYRRDKIMGNETKGQNSEKRYRQTLHRHGHYTDRQTLQNVWDKYDEILHAALVMNYDSTRLYREANVPLKVGKIGGVFSILRTIISLIYLKSM